MCAVPSTRRWRQRGLLVALGAGGGIITSIVVWALARVSFALAEIASNQANDWITGGIIFGAVLLISAVVSGIGGGLAGGWLSGLIVRRIWRTSRGWLIGWTIVWTFMGIGLHVAWLSNANPDLSLILIAGWTFLGALIALFFALIAPPWNVRS